MLWYPFPIMLTIIFPFPLTCGFIVCMFVDEFGSRCCRPTPERYVYNSSCKEIHDSNSSSPSGEYRIRTVTGRILEKVKESTICIISVGWHRQTARRVASHPVVIVLRRKLIAECDRQATVVGRLLTTLGDDRSDVVKLFLVHRLEKTSRGNYAYF